MGISFNWLKINTQTLVNSYRPFRSVFIPENIAHKVSWAVKYTEKHKTKQQQQKTPYHIPQFSKG